METMNALVFDRFGGPEVLVPRSLPRPEPGPGEVLLRTRAIGLNFADIYRRRGDYHLAGDPPWVAGYEAAGEVSVLGSDVADLAVGDRICVADVPHANAEFMLVPVEHALPLPDAIDFQLGTALPLQGLTAQYLVRDSHPVTAGETVLIHAASGGVGRMMVQMVTAAGARAIGLTTSNAKLETIREAGASEAVLLAEGWEDRLREITGGRGVDVAYDSVGSTLNATLAVVRDCGTVVFYGMAGGDPTPVDPRLLMDRSLTLTGGDLWSWLTSGEERRRRAAELFAEVVSGRIEQRIAATFPLAEGAEAHRFLEAGTSAGKILLIP